MQNIDQEQLLKLTQTIIGFKSISPNEAGCITYIENYLKNLGMVTIRVDKNGTSNLIARFGQDKDITFAFAGHIDVVPPGDLSKWKHDPFTLTKNENKLYGRGIADMKGAVSAFILALETHLKTNPEPNVALFITSDEEASSINGTPLIVDYLKEKQIKIQYCLLGEPTSVNTLGDVIKIGRRGSLSANLQINGKQGHVAYPHLCNNPIHLFAAALAEISSITWDNGNDHFPPTSLQFTNLHSGIGVNNVIPGSLITSFNIRYNDLHLADNLKTKITDILNKYNLNYEIEWENSAKPFITRNGDLIKIIHSAIFETQQIIPELKTDGGTSDGRFLIDVVKELVEFGLNNATIHQINENIVEADLSAISNIYLTILNKIFND